MPRKRELSIRKGASSFTNDLNQVLDRVYRKYPSSVSHPAGPSDDLKKFRKRHKEDAAELAEKLDELRTLREKSEELATLREALRDLREQVRATRALREQLGSLGQDLKS
ncbi:MAG: hypothetical protein WCA32_18230 [Chromatiaceae bacterium]|jgi:uncharacterized coiled-coil DUF342 family protein